MLAWVLLCAILAFPIDALASLDTDTTDEVEWDLATDWDLDPALYNDTDLLCPYNCSGHGTCNNYTAVCSCDTKWTGPGCQYRK